MRLYERSVDLQLKLDAAQAADTSSELLARGNRLVEALEQAADYFEGVARFCDTGAIGERADLDVKAVSQAVKAFRGGISRHSAAALQQAPASTLQSTARAQRDRAARWLSNRWRNRFAEYDPLLDRVATQHLVGSASHRRTALSRAATLQAARRLDPVTDAAELGRTLGAGDVTAWTAAIRVLGTELRDALAAIDTEQAALSPEVREALRRAGADGLPLDEVTDELLAALRRAGVDEHLVVRRR